MAKDAKNLVAARDYTKEKNGASLFLHLDLNIGITAQKISKVSRYIILVCLTLLRVT